MVIPSTFSDLSGFCGWAFVGLGGYSLWSLWRQLSDSRRFVLGGVGSQLPVVAGEFLPLPFVGSLGFVESRLVFGVVGRPGG